MALYSTHPTELTRLVDNALPAMSGSGVTYNRERNMYVSNGYTSAMGHTYFQGVQLSDRVAIKYSIGVGGWGSHPTFLNAVQVYCFNGKEKVLIGQKFYDCCFYSDWYAKEQAKGILLDYLKSQAKMIGANVNDTQLDSYATQQIDAAVSNAPKLNA